MKIDTIYYKIKKLSLKNIDNKLQNRKMQQPEQQMNQIQEIYLKVNKNFKVIMDSDPATSR